MKINYIKMYNFGSYAGENFFDTSTSEAKNIIIFGGKNGAGKTTLFTAVTLCLYGCFSMGYKSNNTYYIRKISKLINDTAKKEADTKAYVEVSLSIPSGNTNYEYVLRRSWRLNNEKILETLINRAFPGTRSSI